MKVVVFLRSAVKARKVGVFNASSPHFTDEVSVNKVQASASVQQIRRCTQGVGLDTDRDVKLARML